MHATPLILDPCFTDFTAGDCAYLAAEIVNRHPDQFEFLIISDMQDCEIEESSYHVVAYDERTGLTLDAYGVQTLEESASRLADQCEIPVPEMFPLWLSLEEYQDTFGGHEKLYDSDPAIVVDFLLAEYAKHTVLA